VREPPPYRETMNPSEDGLPRPERYWAILTLMVGLSMAVLDTAIVNVALPTIAHDMKATASDSIWVVNAYQLAVLVSLLPFASFGDIFGYRRVYRFGIVLFTASSLFCALSPSLTMLTVGRALQGLGASGLMSVNTALIRYTYPRRQLGRGIAMTALVVATSSAAGPTVAAGILSVASWQWLFAVNVPIGVATWLLSMRLPYTEPTGHHFDLVSAGLSALTFGLLVSGVSGIGHGENAIAATLELVGALAVGAMLVRRQAELPMPLFPVDLFRHPLFSLSVATSVCSFVAQGIAFVSLPFYLQDELGISQVATGLLLTPWPVTVAVVAPIAGRLADRYPAGILGGIGLSTMCVGFVLLVWLPAHPTTSDLLWRIGVCGFGFGLFQSPNNRAMISSAPRERSGGAGAIQGTARLLGQTIGAALVALVFGVGAGSASARMAVILAACFAAAGTLASLTRLFDAVRAPQAKREPAPADARGPAE